MSNIDQPKASAGPVSWPEVIAQVAPAYDDAPSLFANLPERLAKSSPPRYAGGRLGGFDVTVAALAVLRGPSSAAALFPLASPALPRIVSEIGDTLDRVKALPAIFTLSYCNTVRCCGEPLPDVARQLEQKWLPLLAEQARDQTEPNQHSLALAACAAADPGSVRVFAQLPKLNDRWAPYQVFGFNVPDFASYLATAIAQSRPYLEVEPAWLDFVHRFPYLLDTRMLDWPGLLFAARAVYATLGKLPEGEVALEVHKLLTGA